jgi:hypothetical protein
VNLSLFKMFITLAATTTFFAVGIGHAEAKENSGKQEKEDKEIKGKNDDKKGHNPYEKAMAIAKARDLENRSIKLTVKIGVTDIAHLGDFSTLSKTKTGVVKTREGFSLFIRKANFGISGDGVEKSVTKPFLHMNILTHKFGADALELLKSCREAAKSTLAGEAALNKVVVLEVPYHNVVVSQQELLRHYGAQKFFSRMNRTKGEKKSFDYKKYIEEIEDSVVLRNGVSFDVDVRTLSCDQES